MTEPGPKTFTLPDWIPAQEWGWFEEMRNKQKKRLTDRARTCIVNSLAKMKAEGQDVGKILDQSTVNCWLDVYPLRNGNGNGHKDGVFERALRRANAATAR